MKTVGTFKLVIPDKSLRQKLTITPSATEICIVIPDVLHEESFKLTTKPVNAGIVIPITSILGKFRVFSQIIQSPLVIPSVVLTHFHVPYYRPANNHGFILDVSFTNQEDLLY